MVLLAISSYGIYRTFATPSGQTQSIEGGGFCSGNYTVYNNTVDKLLYAQNCFTGVNDFAAFSDIGSLLTTNVFPAVKSQGGGLVNLRGGYYAAVSSVTFYTGASAFIQCGIKLQGAQGGEVLIGAANPVNGTLIVAKTNSMAVLKADTTPGPAAPSVIGCDIQDLTISAGTTTGSTAVDFRMTETRVDGVFKRIGLDQGTNGFTGGGLVLNGNEDTVVDDFEGGFSASITNQIDITWNTATGNIILQNSALTTAQVASQTIEVIGTTFSTLELIGNSNSMILTGDYMANGVGTCGFCNSRINLNGFTLDTLRMSGGWIALSGGGVTSLFGGTGQVWNSGFGGVDWAFVSGTPVWNAGGATLTKQVSDGSNHVNSGTTPTGFPFTRDGNNNF